MKHTRATPASGLSVINDQAIQPISIGPQFNGMSVIGWTLDLSAPVNGPVLYTIGISMVSGGSSRIAGTVTTDGDEIVIRLKRSARW